MNTALPLLVIGLLFGGGIGFTIAAANGITLDGHDHSAHGTQGHEATDHGSHGEVLSLPASATAPTLTIRATEDPLSGWNLHIETQNFTFSPQHASLAHVDGEGHAHVYLNGVKLGRFYGAWVHLDDLPGGEVVVDVTLNANDHRSLAVDGIELRQSITLQN